MKKVPVVLGWDHTKQIGTLEVDETQLPPGANWSFSLGYRILESEQRGDKTVATKIELVEVSPVLDALIPRD